MDFVVSDLHFQHGNIIRFDERPFKSVDEMDKQLIRNWNRVVGNNDTVYVLGDMFYQASMEKAEEILQKLNGKIHYIYGNHERLLKSDKRLTDTYFEATYDYLELPYTYDGQKHKLVLSHYPIPVFNGHFRENVTHLYGHVHKASEQVLTTYSQYLNFENSPIKNTHKMLNVGAMMTYMEYEPKPIGYVLREAEERSKKMYDYHNKNGFITLKEFKEQTQFYL